MKYVAALFLFSFIPGCTAMKSHERVDITNTVRAGGPVINVVHVIESIDGPGVVAALDFFKHASGPVVLVFRSMGGSVYGGLELLRAMEEYPHPIICRVDVAMSMGAVLTSACTTRVGLPRTIMMMHGASGRSGGKAGDLQTDSDHLRVISLALGRQFCRRLKISQADCMAKFAGNKEWFFDAEEALAVGAIDHIAR